MIWKRDWMTIAFAHLLKAIEKKGWEKSRFNVEEEGHKRFMSKRDVFFPYWIKKARVSLRLKFETRCDQTILTKKTTITKTSCLMMYQKLFFYVLYIKVSSFFFSANYFIDLNFFLAKIICERWKFWSGTVPMDVSVSSMRKGFFYG